MKSVAVFGTIACFLCMSFVVYAQQDVNHYCMGECGAKGHWLGYCRSLCSTTNESGEKTKDMACLSSCLNKGYTNYYCYSSCETSAGKTPQGAGAGKSPEQ